MQPFSVEFGAAYDLIKQAVLAAGATAFRLDKISATTSVIEEFYRAIESADLIICDLSESNPNVMYELGYAHALQKPVILISNQLANVPFDLRGVRYLRYDLFSISGTGDFVHELESLTTEALRDPRRFADRPRTDPSVNSVFVSYSHKDQEALRRLMVHLRPLRRQG